MKNQVTKTLVFAAILSLVIASCKKDDSTAATVSTDEAANAVGDMVTSDFAGSTSDATSMSGNDAAHAGSRVVLNGRTLATSCGVLVSKDTTRASKAGAIITYTWTGDYALTLACNGKIPTALNLTFSGSGTRTGLKVSSVGESDGTFAVTGFDAGSANYTLNGTFDRSETVTEIVGSKSYTATHALTVSSVLINKTTYAIAGGSATYTMTGTYGTTTYTHTGTITFAGGGSATITVDGNNYLLNLNTGVVTKS